MYMGEEKKCLRLGVVLGVFMGVEMMDGYGW